MDSKTVFRFAALAAAVLLTAACIYPYTVDIQQGDEYPIVVDGDIHIGGTTTVQLSYVRPMDETDYVMPPVLAEGYIEGEDGTRITSKQFGGGAYYDSYSQLSSTLSFDTSNLREDQRYRLVFTTVSPEDGSPLNRFESDWLQPCPAPTIDALTYSKNDDFKELWIGLSMHCHGSHYFRWTFSETWEYHSDILSHLEYVPSSWDAKLGRTVGGTYQAANPTLYYCWNSRRSADVNLFSTVNQTEDRFHTIPLTDKRLQVMYRIDVQLEALSENAYNYWKNIQENTWGQGSIFAPVPSNMASNVHCVTDASVQVIGYLNAAASAKGFMYYDNSKEGFYKSTPLLERGDTTVAASNYNIADNLLRIGYLPYAEIYDMGTTPSAYTWAKALCIDCRMQGGTKNKPKDWPDGHI